MFDMIFQRKMKFPTCLREEPIMIFFGGGLGQKREKKLAQEKKLNSTTRNKKKLNATTRKKKKSTQQPGRKKKLNSTTWKKKKSKPYNLKEKKVQRLVAEEKKTQHEFSARCPPRCSFWVRPVFVWHATCPIILFRSCHES